MVTSLNFDVKSVRKKVVLDFSEDIPSGDFKDCLATAGEFASPLKVDLKLVATEDGIAYDGSVTGRWELECNRCLAPIDQKFEVHLSGKVSLDETVIDVGEEVRQALTLAVPMKIFCRQDCKGFCPHCHRNRNVKECGCKAPRFGATMRKRNA